MFQLFHRTDEPSFICAVPTGIEPPRFLRRAWTFEGRAREIESEQLAFDRSAAHEIARQNGFYLYARL
jgi:hypothetical protein